MPSEAFLTVLFPVDVLIMPMEQAFHIKEGKTAVPFDQHPFMEKSSQLVLALQRPDKNRQGNAKNLASEGVTAGSKCFGKEQLS